MVSLHSFALSPAVPLQSGPQATLPSTSSGLRQHFSSPCKARNVRKSPQFISIPGQNNKCQQLLDCLNNLLSHQQSPSLSHGESSASQPQLNNHTLDALPEYQSAPGDCIQHNIPDDDNYFPNTENNFTTPVKTSCHSDNWKKVIPILVEPFVQYITWMISKPIPLPSLVISFCVQECALKKNMLICLYFDHTYAHYTCAIVPLTCTLDFCCITVHSYKCSSHTQVLLCCSPFPTASSQPWMAAPWSCFLSIVHGLNDPAMPSMC